MVLIFSHTEKKKLKAAEFLLNDNLRRNHYDKKSVSKNNYKLDMSWVLGFNVTPEKSILVWPGWNTKISEALQYTQKIWYLQQMNESPINH